MANFFEFELRKNDKGTRPSFKGEKLTVSFVERENNDSLYTAGKGLAKNGGNLIEVFAQENGKKYVRLFNDVNKLNKLVGLGVKQDENGYLLFEAKELKVFSNGKISLLVEGNETINKVEVSAAEIVVSNGKETTVLPQNKPINLEFPTTFFQDCLDGKIKNCNFPAQIFEMIENANPEFENVSAKQFNVFTTENGKRKQKQIKFISVGNENSRRLYVAQGSEFREIRNEAYSVIHGVNADTNSHDLAFRFHGGEFGSGKQGSKSALAKELTKENAEEIVQYISQQFEAQNLAKNFIYNAPASSYETYFQNSPAIDVKNKKQEVGVLKGEEKKEDKKEEKNDKATNSPKHPPQQPKKPKLSLFKKLKNAVLGILLIGCIAVGALSAVTGLLAPAFVFFGVGVGVGSIFASEVVADIQQLNKKKKEYAKNLQKANEKELEYLEAKEKQLDKQQEALKQAKKNQTEHLETQNQEQVEQLEENQNNQEESVNGNKVEEIVADENLLESNQDKKRKKKQNKVSVAFSTAATTIANLFKRKEKHIEETPIQEEQPIHEVKNEEKVILNQQMNQTAKQETKADILLKKINEDLARINQQIQSNNDVPVQTEQISNDIDNGQDMF